MVDPPRGPTAGVGVTVAELPGTRWERIRNDSSRLNGRRYRVADCRSGLDDCVLNVKQIANQAQVIGPAIERINETGAQW
jgi:hypothetical protein